MLALERRSMELRIYLRGNAEFTTIQDAEAGYNELRDRMGRAGFFERERKDGGRFCLRTESVVGVALGHSEPAKEMR